MSEFQTHPTLPQLMAFDRGLLPRVEQAAIERHVSGCAECCSRLETSPEDSFTGLIRSAYLHTWEGGLIPAHPDAEQGTRTLDGSGQVTIQIEPPNHPRYEMYDLLGSGGMGAVFKAKHRLMDRLVAVKVIHKDRINRPGVVERFQLEVKAVAQFAHPNIVTAYDAEQVGDQHLLVMEFVEGTSLDRLIQNEGALSVAEACRLIRQAAEGLQYAFERGMIHRDIKPANLIVTSDGQLKILDFGLAKLVRESAPVELGGDGGGSLTQTGSVVGTPDYISPEQAWNPGQADIRSDLYSLGCTFYHLLCGHPPFPGGSVLQKLQYHRDRDAMNLFQMDHKIPEELGQIVARLTAKNPLARYQTPRELAAALDHFLDEFYPEEKPAAVYSWQQKLAYVATVAAGMMLAVTLAWYFTAGPGGEPRHDQPAQQNESTPPANSSPQARIIPGAEDPFPVYNNTVPINLNTLPETLDRIFLVPDGKSYLSIASNLGNESWQVCELRKGEISRVHKRFYPERFAVSADSRLVLSTQQIAIGTDKDWTTELWDLQTGTTLWNEAGAARSLAFSPDSQQFVVGSTCAGKTAAGNPTSIGTLSVWDIRAMKRLRYLELGPGRYPMAVSFGENETILAQVDNSVYRWSVADGKELPSFPVRASYLEKRFSLDGRTFVARRIRACYVYDTKSGKKLWSLYGSEIQYIALSADGSLLVSVGTADVHARQAGEETAEELAADDMESRKAKDDWSFHRARIWDVRTGKELCELKYRNYPVTDVSFSLDNRYALVQCDDLFPRLWLLPAQLSR
jgi:serine/threonine protein kinase